MDNTNIIDVDERSFNQKIIEASEKKLVIVDFWAPWCGPCKQLTPLLENVVNNSDNKVLLAKVNIDENQQIAGQLRIQSIPAVFAFKNKQIVNAFQGVITEKQIIEFIEKCLGEKLKEDFTDFFNNIENKLKDKEFAQAKEALIEFIADKPKEQKAIYFYILSLIGLKDFNEANSLIESLDEDLLKNSEIQSAIQNLNIAKKNSDGPDLEELLKEMNANPGNVEIICNVADKYFSINEYENAFELLLKIFPKHKDKSKKKILELFNALGQNHQITIEYRKKLSKIMFS